jgi:NADH-ubiquinone oxidoreductase chain 1
MPEIFVNESILSIESIILGLKTCLFCFMFVWFRATRNWVELKKK